MKIFAILTLLLGCNSLVSCLPPQNVQARNFRLEQVDDSVRLPYIGGAKGQVLEIRQRPDGTIFSRILMDEEKSDAKRQPDTIDQLKTKNSIPDEVLEEADDSNFEMNLASIQQAAQELVNLQEAYKENGKLTAEQKRVYSQSLERLGVSAQKLANFHGSDDEIRLLLEQPKAEKTKSGSKKKQPEDPRFPPFYIKKTELVEKAEDKDCEDPVLEEGETTPSTTTVAAASTTTAKPQVVVVQSSNVATSGTSNDEGQSSVAEAKPVGLAVAGVGGVASSKPVATAVVGPEGLAVAKPVATAIAGLKPGEFGQLGIPLPSKVKGVQFRGASASLPYSGKYGMFSYGSDDGEEESTRFLVGPEFLAEARLSNKQVDPNEEEYSGGDKYLQRRSFNAALRYPQIYSPYPQYYNPSNTYAPVRLYYAQ